MPQNEYVCRVCGYINDEITWEKGIYPTYNICPCCGVEFGYLLENIEKVGLCLDVIGF